MAQNKEQLDKLLQFISAIIKDPGNEEFTNKLRALVSPQGETNAFRVSQIEKYLGLDYKLDNYKSIIDYTFVCDDYTRHRLESDYREMLRYRFGVRSHVIDFEKVCQYAIYQIEMMINYFYSTLYPTLGDFVSHYTTINKYPKAEDITSIEAVPLSSKLYAFNKEYKLTNRVNSLLGRIREVRNDQSHRSTKKENDSFMADFQRLSTSFPKYKNGEINTYELENNSLPPKYDEIKDLILKYNYLLWKKIEPFEEVEKVLIEMRNMIRKNLS